MFPSDNWIHFPFIGTVNQGPGNVPIFVLAARKLTAKLVVHRFTLNYSVHFFHITKNM